MMSEITCWWCVTTQIWVVVLICWSNCQPIITTTQNWVVTRHQREISEFIPQISFCRETIGNMRNVGCFLYRLEGKTVRGLQWIENLISQKVDSNCWLLCFTAGAVHLLRQDRNSDAKCHGVQKMFHRRNKLQVWNRTLKYYISFKKI